MKDFCVSDITMNGVTLNDLTKVFSEVDERVRRAHSVEEVVPILRETYFCLKARVLEDYITKEMENKPDADKLNADKPDEILMKVLPDENVVKMEYESGPDTVVTYYKSNYTPASSSTSTLPITAIPRPTEVPPEFRASRADGEVYPGEIIYLNLDGHWRPYRVMAKENGAVRLLGLFSIGEINEKEPQYCGSLSSQFCDDWCEDIMKRDRTIEDSLELSPIGTMAFYVHVPDWGILRADCEAISGDLVSAWYNDDDMSNIQVYTGCPAMTSVLCGEDGKLHEFHYGDVEDTEDCFPVEVHPAFTLRLGSLPYYYHPVDHAELAEFS